MAHIITDELVDCTKKLWYTKITINGYDIKIADVRFMKGVTDAEGGSHKHIFYELCYIIDGPSRIEINGVTQNMEKNQFCIIPPNNSHTLFCDDTTYVALRWELKKQPEVEFHNSFMQVVERKLNNIARLVYDDDSRVMNQIILLMNTVAERDNVLMLQLKCAEMIAALCDYCFGNLPVDDVKYVETQSANSVLLERAVNYIYERINDKLTPTDVAAHVHVAYSYLNSLFRNYYNETLGAFINKKKLHMAKYLLKYTDEKISFISAKLGYCNESYFCNSFKKTFGISPSAYRREMNPLED